MSNQGNIKKTHTPTLEIKAIIEQQIQQLKKQNNINNFQTYVK